MSDRNYLADVRVINDLAFAVTLAYVGYELYSVRTAGNGRLEFCIVIPSMDFDEYLKEFLEGRLAIADARAFGRTHAEVRQCMKIARLEGQWVNPDLAQYARDTNFTVA